MSYFEDSFAYAYDVMDDMAGEDVTYIHNQTQIKIRAIPGTENGTEDMTGGRTKVNSRTLNWLIDPAQLVIDGQRFEPIRGNEIVRADGRCYRVGAPQQGPPWTWQDGYNSFLQIQTIEVKPKATVECP